MTEKKKILINFSIFGMIYLSEALLLLIFFNFVKFPCLTSSLVLFVALYGVHTVVFLFVYYIFRNELEKIIAFNKLFWLRVVPVTIMLGFTFFFFKSLYIKNLPPVLFPSLGCGP